MILQSTGGRSRPAHMAKNQSCSFMVLNLLSTLLMLTCDCPCKSRCLYMVFFNIRCFFPLHMVKLHGQKYFFLELFLSVPSIFDYFSVKWTRQRSVLKSPFQKRKWDEESFNLKYDLCACVHFRHFLNIGGIDNNG